MCLTQGESKRQRECEKGKIVDKSERSGMATHGMHNTALSKPLVMHRVAWVWPVRHQEDGKSDGLDEGVESVVREEKQ